MNGVENTWQMSALKMYLVAFILNQFKILYTKAISLNAISEFRHHNIIIYSNGNELIVDHKRGYIEECR